MLGGCGLTDLTSKLNVKDNQKAKEDTTKTMEEVKDQVVDKMTSETWEVFNSTSGRFKVKFPKYPATVADTLDVQGIKINYTQYSSEEDSGDQYLVQVNEYQVDPSAIQTKAALEGALNGSVMSTKGNELKTSEFITVGSYEGMDYVIFNSVQNMYMRGRNIIVDNVLYTILVASKDENPQNYQEFIDSFQFQ